MTSLHSSFRFGFASLLLTGLIAHQHSAVAEDVESASPRFEVEPVAQKSLPDNSIQRTAFTTSELVTAVDAGCGPNGCSTSCDRGCPLMATLEGRDTLFDDDNLVDQAFESVLGWKNDLPVPIKVGAWHWYAWDLTGNNAGGYGIPGLRGTYWWEIIADPTIDLDDGTKIGIHSNLRLRDGDNFRSFFDSKFWFYELYAHVSTEELGTLKAGQVWKRFGLDWDGVFFGNTAYFDGFKLDPDYGLSWEKTTQLDDNLSVDTFANSSFMRTESTARSAEEMQKARVY